MSHDHPHDHTHGDHGHAHGDHEHPHQDAENPWAGQGSVMLDIGGDVGALIVEMPTELVGLEVEIRPIGSQEGHHPHVAVVARPAGAVTVPSLVYPDLQAGDYELYEKGTDHVELVAHVDGGSVSQAAWPVATPGGAASAPSAGPGGGG